MKPFFGLSNRIGSIFVSFVLFGYGVYSIFSDGILENLRIRRIHDSGSQSISNPETGRSIHIRYNFDSTTASIFGLYDIEIAIIKVSVSFLLFVVLLVGATQRSKILLRIWMMFHALVIVLGFLSALVTLTDGHFNNHNTFSDNNISTLLLTFAFCLWSFAIVLSLHEEIELVDQHTPEENIRNYVVAKASSPIGHEKCPAFYDC